MRPLLTVRPPSKPWQCQLLAHLDAADCELQVLRMTIAMQRTQQEIAEAVLQLQVTLRTANAYVAGGRSDGGRKTAVQLAFSLGQRIKLAFDR